MSMYIAKIIKGSKAQKNEVLGALKEITELYKRRGVIYRGGNIEDVMYLPVDSMHFRGMWWKVV